MDIEKMCVNDFIKGVATGRLKERDINKYAASTINLIGLLWDMKLASIVVENGEEYPMIRDDVERDRIQDAIWQIEKEFSVSMMLEDKPESFPLTLTKNDLLKLYSLLKEKNMIDDHTPECSFLYWFGYGEYTLNITPIRWTETKQVLRELLEGLYKRKGTVFADIERTASICFLQRDGKPMKLAKNKPKPSYSSDAINNFLATIQSY